MLGGAIGGGAGFRGGQWSQAALRPTSARTPAVPASNSSFTPKKPGEVEPGAVPSTARLEAKMARASQREGMSAKGYPDLPASEAKNFGDDVRPWNGDDHPGGTIRRVIGADNNPNGPYWQAKVPKTEAEWRGGAAVKNDWNGNGAYVESSSKGLRGWIGKAAPQRSSDGKSMLPGDGEQIWIEPGSASPGSQISTPWHRE